MSRSPCSPKIRGFDKLPARGDEPLVKAILEDWQRIMWEKDAANGPLVFVEDGRMVFRVEVPLPVESEEQ